MSEIYPIAGFITEVGDEHRYHEFLRVPALSAEIYVLPVGSTDRQTPHQEDEIYFVIRGRAKVKLGKEGREVREGDVIFVERRLEHRFFDVEEGSIGVFWNLQLIENTHGEDGEKGELSAC